MTGGATTAPGRPSPPATSLEDHVADLVAVVGDRPAVVVGHSYGGGRGLGRGGRGPAIDPSRRCLRAALAVDRLVAPAAERKHRRRGSGHLRRGVLPPRGERRRLGPSARTGPGRASGRRSGAGGRVGLHPSCTLSHRLRPHRRPRGPRPRRAGRSPTTAGPSMPWSELLPAPRSTKSQGRPRRPPLATPTPSPLSSDGWLALGTASPGLIDEGRPRTRSAMMLRCTSAVPPPMVRARANRYPCDQMRRGPDVARPRRDAAVRVDRRPAPRQRLPRLRAGPASVRP